MSTRPCPLCDRKCAGYQGLQAHRNAKHPTCPSCRQHFANDYEVKKHQMTEEHCYCKQHDMFFDTHDLHQEHKYKTHISRSNAYACVACRTLFASQPVLDEHRQGHGHAAVQIAIERRDVSVTIPTDNEARNLRCDDCDLDFSTLFILRGHKLTVKHDASRRLRCPFSDECDDALSSPNALLTHLENGTCKSGINCLKLDALLHENGPDQHMALANEANIAATLTTKFEDPQHNTHGLHLAQYQCHCGAHFQDFGVLLTHIRTSEHMVVCSCFATFANNAAFIAHQRSTAHLRNITSSTIVNPHAVTCPCGLQVRDQGCLEQHHKATGHQGTEVAKCASFCPICHRTMAKSNKETLKKHISDKHPSCPTCYQVFQYEKDLQEHQREQNKSCYRWVLVDCKVDVLKRQSADIPEEISDAFDLSGASTLFEESDGESIHTSTEANSTGSTPPTSCASSTTFFDELEIEDDKDSRSLNTAASRSRSTSLSSNESDGGVLLPRDESSPPPTVESMRKPIIPVPRTRSFFKRPALLTRSLSVRALAPEISRVGERQVGIIF
ncbi:hypothetical protein PRZ48_007872 [Zasmidium cellare]|uniref:C2H2-type domain-containing protein n=1 Tax=Zasmidium cellare TaxID=395010 RepID=A0ABR0ELB6_ZASCE|nr:hypothetical protein PRZ48_007872 [Zasmidium cellare]